MAESDPASDAQVKLIDSLEQAARDVGRDAILTADENARLDEWKGRPAIGPSEAFQPDGSSYIVPGRPEVRPKKWRFTKGMASKVIDRLQEQARAKEPKPPPASPKPGDVDTDDPYSATLDSLIDQVAYSAADLLYRDADRIKMPYEDRAAIRSSVRRMVYKTIPPFLADEYPKVLGAPGAIPRANEEIRPIETRRPRLPDAQGGLTPKGVWQEFEKNLRRMVDEISLQAAAVSPELETGKRTGRAPAAEQQTRIAAKLSKLILTPLLPVLREKYKGPLEDAYVKGGRKTIPRSAPSQHLPRSPIAHPVTKE